MPSANSAPKRVHHHPVAALALAPVPAGEELVVLARVELAEPLRADAGVAVEEAAGGAAHDVVAPAPVAALGREQRLHRGRRRTASSRSPPRCRARRRAPRARAPLITGARRSRQRQRASCTAAAAGIAKGRSLRGGSARAARCPMRWVSSIATASQTPPASVPRHQERQRPPQRARGPGSLRYGSGRAQPRQPAEPPPAPAQRERVRAGRPAAVGAAQRPAAAAPAVSCRSRACPSSRARGIPRPAPRSGCATARGARPRAPAPRRRRR